jgi:hypothetical protein
MRNLTLTASLVLAALSAPGAALRAQGNAEPAPFLLAIAGQQLPRGERAVIIRTANGTQMDLIVLAPDAKAHHTLVGAVALLRDLRAKEPRPTTTDVVSMPYAEAIVDIPAAQRGRLEAALRQARQGEGRKLGEFGDVHVVVINPRSLK